jgi:hypothetical protein
MRQAIANISLTVLLGLTLVGCGSNSSVEVSSPNPPSPQMVPVSFSIGDNPPAGVTILRFQIQVTAATLQPADLTQPAISMLTSPVEVELEHLQTEQALLSNLSVPAGTYNSLTATFTNPQMTVLNQSNQILTIAPYCPPNAACPAWVMGCFPNQVCQFTPPLNPMTATVQAPTAPFPITLSADSPLALMLHFDVNASVQDNTFLSISPVISLQQVPPPPTGGLQGFHMMGRISAIDAPNFTLQSDGVLPVSSTGAVPPGTACVVPPGSSGSSTVTLTLAPIITCGVSTVITTNSDTKYGFDGACAAQSFSCLAVGQAVNVAGNLMSSGTLVASEVELLEPEGEPALEGVVVGVDTAQNQLELVLTDLQEQLAGAGLGLALQVQVTSSAVFTIDSDGLTLPSGLGFGSVQDLLVGQVVEVHPLVNLTPVPTNAPTGNVVMPPAQFIITADRVCLQASELTGTVSAVNAQANPPNFTLGTLPPLFTGAGISQIEVEPVAGTRFENLSGLGGLNAGDMVSVGGLLFNTPSVPTLIAQRVMKR